MNVFNLISAGGGSGGGLYLWKKSGFAEASKELTANYNDSWTSDYQFSRTIYESTEYEFINGKYQLINPTSHTVTGTAGANSYSTKAGHFYVVDENPASEMFEVVSGCTYPPSWIVATGPYQLTFRGNSSLWSSNYKPVRYYLGYAFVDYVASDKEDAYPDGGEQGGFYYERYEPFNVDVLGCTKYTYGTFTPTSSQYNQTIIHNMGIKPKYAFVWAETRNAGSNRQAYAVPISSATPYYGEWYGDSVSLTDYGSGSTTNETSMALYSAQKFTAGITYHYILIA